MTWNCGKPIFELISDGLSILHVEWKDFSDGLSTLQVYTDYFILVI